MKASWQTDSIALAELVIGTRSHVEKSPGSFLIVPLPTDESRACIRLIHARSK